MPERTFITVKLHFGTTALHLSRGKGDYDQSEEILHSDTLKSALYVAALQLEPTLQEREASLRFFSSFSVSSAFPFFRSEYFFPKPMTRIQTLEGFDPQDPKQSKKLKKITFLGVSYFENLLQGGDRNIQSGHLLGSSMVSDHPAVLDRSKSVDLHIMSREVVQRVIIPRDQESDAVPFFVERLYFNPEAGLYFLLETKDAATIKKIEQALTLLGDMGIGTDRNVGHGQFSVSFGELKLQVPENASYQVNLSLYCPTYEELQQGTLQDASYQLLQRGGWISVAGNDEHQTLRKASVHMFTEGSVFSTSRMLKGKIVDLKPKYQGFAHPVWRDGTALFLPIIPKEL